MIKKFKKGFSLVELLVVIAIIGILAAVGITAYSGYTSNAKIKASASNHSSVEAFLNSELAKCASGSGSYSWNETCDTELIDHATIAGHFDTVLGLKNPYATDQAAVTSGGGVAGTQGFTNVTCTGGRATRNLVCAINTLLKTAGDTTTSSVKGY